MTSIRVGRASAASLESFQSLTSSEYRDVPITNLEYVAWRHLASPYGASDTVEMVSGEIVGRMWINKYQWRLDGESVSVSNPVDFLVRQDFRNPINSLRLFQATMKHCGAISQLTYHTSNPVTDPLYRNLLKLKPMTELDGAVLPLSPVRTIRKMFNLNLRKLEKPIDKVWRWLLLGTASVASLRRLQFLESVTDAEKRSVFQLLETEETIHNERSLEYMLWRYQGAGEVAYEFVWIRDRGTTVGYVVTTDRTVENIRSCFVVDIVWPGRPSKFMISAVWFELVRRAARRNVESLFFFGNLKNERITRLMTLPFVKIPRRYLPQRVPVFIRTALPVDERVLADGYYLLTDFDLF
jgi:hypothetical protein